MIFQLMTPTGTKFSDVFSEVHVTTPEGEMTILPGHEPLTALVLPGEVSVKSNRIRWAWDVGEGVLEVTPKYVRLISKEK